MPSAFLSYSSINKEFAQKLKESLKEKGIDVKIDSEMIGWGDDIKAEIGKAIKDTDVTITIVSQESLYSRWVIWEFTETLKFQEVLEQRKLIPIYLDSFFSDASAPRRVIQICEEEIDKLIEEINLLNTKKCSTAFLDIKKDNWIYLHDHISKFLEYLGEHHIGDFSKDENFESNLSKLVEMIRRNVRSSENHQRQKISHSDTETEKEKQKKPIRENENKENDKVNESQIKKAYAVFLSFNDEDIDEVEKIAKYLNDNAKLHPWFNKWELIPGEPWLQSIERGLMASATCAVFVGKSGEGTWQQREVSAALQDQSKNPDFRVIPVLLPVTPRQPNLPKFLDVNTLVDFRGKEINDAAALWLLECGIRGVKPGSGRLKSETLEEETKASDGDTENQGEIVNLDGYVESFQDRDDYRKELTEFFYCKQEDDPQRAKTMVISGFPGIGKSALAANIINKNDPNQEKTIYFHKNINFDIVFDCCLERLNQKERDELRGDYDELKKERSIGKNTTDRIHGLVKNFLSKFRQKGVVIVLNNMEELIENEKIRDEHEDLKILIDESRDPNYNVKFLITSYNRILSYQPEKYLKPLNDEDCVKILKKKLEEKQVVLNFPDIPSDQELKEVVIPVCGIPLAIDLILWGLELHWTWERLREVLKSEPLIKENSFYKKLEGYHDLDKDKVQEIEKIFTRLFEGLHKDLSEEQKRILEILAVFGNASPEAIHDVLRNLKLKLPEEKRKNYADDSLTVEKIESYLNKPNCRPFIQKIQKTLNQREFRNELARQHVLHLLTEEKEYTRKDMEVWCGKYYHYGFGEYHHDECINEERVTWKKKSDIEPYLKASDHYINAEHYEQLANCLFASHGPLRFLIERGEYRDIIRLFGKIPKEKMPDRWGGSFLIYLGIAYLYSGKLRDAKEKLEETQKYPESKDNIFQIEYYQNLGNCLGQLGDIEKAITNVSKSLGIIETLDEREKKDFSRENRGLVYHSLGYWYAFKDLKEAREWLNKARKEFDNSTNSDKEYYHACSLTVLGDTFLYQGEFDTALNKYNDAWSRLKGKNYNRALYDVRCGMASTYLMSQSMGKRVDIDEKEALELFKKYKNSKLSLDFGTYKAHLLLGMLYLRQDNSIKAKKSFKIALNSIKDLIKENECSNSQTGYVNFDAYFCKILAEYGLFLCGEKESKFDAKRSAKSAMELWGKTGIIERMEQLFRVFNTKDSLKSLSQEE